MGQGYLEDVSFDCFQPANLRDPNCALSRKKIMLSAQENRLSVKHFPFLGREEPSNPS